MKAATLIALPALLVSAGVSAAPLDKPRDDVVWVTHYTTHTTTIEITITVDADETDVPGAFYDNVAKPTPHGSSDAATDLDPAAAASPVAGAAPPPPSPAPLLPEPQSAPEKPVEYERPPLPPQVQPEPVKQPDVQPVAEYAPAAAPMEPPPPPQPQTEPAKQPDVQPVEQHAPAVAPVEPQPQPIVAQQASSTSSDVKGANRHVGDVTFWDVGLGACGWTNSSSEPVVAISKDVFDKFTPGKNPNNNPLCGKTIIIKRNGKEFPCKIVDRCTGCKPGDLDLSPDFFNLVTDHGDGRVHNIEWFADFL